MPLLLILISFVPLWIGNESTKVFAHALIFIQAILAFMLICRTRDVFCLISPVSLIFFYTSLSLGIGAWGFRNEYVLVERDMECYKSWSSMNVSLSVLMLSLSFMVLTERYVRMRKPKPPQSTEVKPKRSLMLSGIVLTPFFVVPLDLSLMGGDGDLSIVPKTVFAIFFLIAVQNIVSGLIRWSMYLGLITAFATFSIQDKREAIFLIFPICFLEFAFKKTKLSFALLIWFLILAAFLLLLLLLMSVARGYGGFGGFSTISEAAPFILKYVESDIFIGGLFANIEVNYFFFHALNAIELVFKDTANLNFGLTIIKPLFIVLPRYFFEWKPDSIIGLYTTAFDPAIRAVGGSWPISILSEFFWNFYFFAPFVTLLFSVFLVEFHMKMVRVIRSKGDYTLAFFLFAHMHLVVLARGSGLDQYAVCVLLALIFILGCWFISFFSKLIYQKKYLLR